MVETRGKKRLISNASKTQAKITLEELCKKIANKTTIYGEERKSGASTSICNQLKMFSKDLKGADDMLHLLNDYKAVETYLNQKKGRGDNPLSVNSLKSYYTSLKVAAEVAEADKPAIEFYTKKMMGHAIESNKEMKQNYIPEKFGDKMPSWTEIENISSEFTGSAKHNINHLICSLYTLIPPRRLEYFNMFFLDKKPNKPPKVQPPKDNSPTDGDGIPWNYIYPEGNAFHMVLGNYKTDKKYGVYQTKLPAPLSKVIDGYIKKKGIKSGDYLLQNRSGEHFKSQGDKGDASKAVSSAFKIKYTKSNLSVNDFRHIFSTSLWNKEVKVKDKFYSEMTNEELEELARSVGHSIIKDLEYRQITPKPKKGKKAPLVDSSSDDSNADEHTNDGAETSRQAEERGEFDLDEPTPDGNDDSNEPTTQEQEAPTPAQEPQTTDKEVLIRTMTKYYELKVKMMEKKLAMLENVL